MKGEPGGKGRSDEFVIRAEGGFVTPLFAEMAVATQARATAGGARNMEAISEGADLWKPRVDLDIDAEGSRCRRYMPHREAGARLLFLAGGLFADGCEGEDPGEPAEDEFDEGYGVEHGEIVWELQDWRLQVVGWNGNGKSNG